MKHERKAPVTKPCEVRKAIENNTTGEPVSFRVGTDSLFLMTAGNGRSGSWYVRRFDPKRGKVWNNGIGSAADLSLAEAKAKAHDLVTDFRRGDAPMPRARRVPGNMPRPATGETGETFADAAKAFLAAKGSKWMETERARYERLLTRKPELDTDGKPKPGQPRIDMIADKPWRHVSSGDVKAVLEPIWKGPNAKPGGLLRSLIERTLSNAEHWRREAIRVANQKANLEPPVFPLFDNVARWKGAMDESGLATEGDDGGHYDATPHKELPGFLAANPDPVLRFLVLTAARLGEVIGDQRKAPMDWAEIDQGAKLWSIPADRMKNGEPHNVPLSDAALACLPPQATGPVFPGTFKAHKHRLTKLMKGHGTLHGMRSTFVDWATEETGSDTIAQLCLSHVKGTKTERAYKRTTLLDKRRELLNKWAAFATGEK
jgi:integrase